MALGWHYKNCYINFSVLIADDEIKVRRIFLLVSIILLVSILFSFSNSSVCYFRLFNFTLRKNRLNTVYASDSIQQERLSVSLEVGRIYFNHLTYLCRGLCCERSKQTLNASQDQYKIPSCQ